MKKHEVYKNWAYIAKTPNENKFKTICKDVIITYNINADSDSGIIDHLSASVNILNELGKLHGSVFVPNNDDAFDDINNTIHKSGYFDCIAVEDITIIETELQQYLTAKIQQVDVESVILI